MRVWVVALLVGIACCNLPNVPAVRKGSRFSLSSLSSSAQVTGDPEIVAEARETASCRKEGWNVGRFAREDFSFLPSSCV